MSVVDRIPTRARTVVPAVVVAAVVLGVAASRSTSWIYNITTVAILAIAVVGLNIVIGLAGQVSFATPAFMAVGGYASANLGTRAGWNPWVALLAGAVAATLFAALIGVPLMRLRGHYLAMGTFALALVVGGLALAAKGVTNGSIGIAGVPPFTIGSLDLSGADAFYWLSCGTCGAAVLAVRLLRSSRVGRAWRAVAARDDVASSLGVEVARYKVMAFAASALLAAVAGSLYVEFTSFVAPDLYSTAVNVQIFTMLFIGGLATTWGPVTGAAVVVLFPVVFSGLRDTQSVVLGVLLLAILVLRPQGIGGGRGTYGPIVDLLPARWAGSLRSLTTVPPIAGARRSRRGASA